MRSKILILLALFASIAGAQNLSTSGNITTSAAACALGSGSGYLWYQLPTNTSSVGIVISGTWSATVQFQGSVDGKTWTSVTANPQPSGSGVTSTTANGTWSVTTSGLAYVCTYAGAYTSGTAAIAMTATTSGGGGGGGGSGSGTVNAGTANQVAYYPGIGTVVGGNSALIKTTADSLFISDALPTSAGTNNVVNGIQSGSNIFHSGTTWFGGNNTLMGMKAGKALTSSADSTIIGYQAAQFLQGGSATGCTPVGSSEEDGIVTAVGELAAGSLNTPTSGGCEISSDFYGQKAGANVGISFNDSYLGTHSGTNGTAGITSSNNSVFVGPWSGGGVAATTSTYNTLVGTVSGAGWAGGAIQHNTGVGYESLATLDGTVANQGDWNSALGNSAGCSVTSGRYNAFLGGEAGGVSANCGIHHITGNYNIGIGRQSIYPQSADVSGSSNIVIGNQMATNPVITSGTGNVIIGALGHNIGAAQNVVALGPNTQINTNGTENHLVLVGDSTSTSAGSTYATALGAGSSASGLGTTAIGGQASASGAGATAIGYQASNSTAGTTVIGGSVVTLSNKGAVNYVSTANGDALDVLAPNLTAGNFVYSLMGVAASSNNSSSNPTFHYVGSGSTSNWASMNFFGNTNNNIAIMASGNNCVNHTTNDCATAWDVNGTVQASAYKTATNCAVNSVSPAACGSAASGAVVIPTTTTSYTVNTSAVTAASRIFVFPRTYAGDLPSTPTCIAPAVTSAYVVSAISAGTSFTITLPSTSGQTCWNYNIVN